MSTPERPQLHPDGISDGYITFLAVAGTFTLLSVVSVSSRFVQRWMIHDFWWDDWAILASLIFAFGLLITTALVATYGGAGYHIATYSIPQLETYLKICLANNIIYNWSIMFSKASVLFFYSRIFSIDRGVLRFIQVIGGILIANCLTCSLGLLLANNPVEGQWTLSVPSTSINAKPFWISMGVVNLVLDLIILGIPQKMVWKLRLSKERRIAISLVFLLGGFVCIATLVRVSYFGGIDVQDITYEFTTPGIWTCVEMNMSIICACLPMVYSMFRVGSSKASTKTGSGKTTSKPVMSIDKQYLNLESGHCVPDSGNYDVHIQSSRKKQIDGMIPLGPIRVDRAFGVD